MTSYKVWLTAEVDINIDADADLKEVKKVLQGMSDSEILRCILSVGPVTKVTDCD